MLRVGKLDELKGKLDNFLSELDDPTKFKDIYTKIVKESESLTV